MLLAIGVGRIRKIPGYRTEFVIVHIKREKSKRTLPCLHGFLSSMPASGSTNLPVVWVVQVLPASASVVQVSTIDTLWLVSIPGQPGKCDVIPSKQKCPKCAPDAFTLARLRPSPPREIQHHNRSFTPEACSGRDAAPRPIAAISGLPFLPHHSDHSHTPIRLCREGARVALSG